MAFVTESKLAATIDQPVALPVTELIQGDWLVLATIKVASPMQISLRYLSLRLTECTVDVDAIVSANKVSANLGLAFVGLYQDYQSGFPGLVPALAALTANALTTFSRTAPVVSATTPGVYSVIVANNMQASSASTIPVSTSIDFKLSVTGSIRLELDSN